MPDTQTYELQIHATDKGLDQLAVVSFEAQEALSRPFSVSVLTRTLDPTDPGSLDPGGWLRKKAAVSLSRGFVPTWFHGVVVAVEHAGSDHKQHQLYRLELAPSLVLLKHTRRTRVFVDMKPLEVVKSVLSEGAVTPIDLKATGAAGQAMPHITQFEESDFDFVSRLLEQEGAAYWFTFGKSGHTMVIGDSSSHHPGAGAVIKADFANEAAGSGDGQGVVTELTRRFEIVAKESVVRDYSETHPKTAALGQKTVAAVNAPGSGGKMNEADYHITQTDSDATTYATRASDGLMNRSCKLVGSSSVLGFRAGVRISVHGKEGYDEHSLITEISHSFSNDAYGNSFSAMPVGRLPWRPQRSTPIPRIDGVVPGIITATAGDQGNGEDGSYRVKLLNGEDDKDRIIRLAQPYAGPAQGVHFPLPPDTEVLLSHEYGHPDRPIIAGAMHNVENPSPVKEANKTQCVVRSAAGAILIFEDKKDEEKTTLQSKALAKLEMDDKPDKEKTTLQSKALAKLEMDDTKDNAKTTLQSTALAKLEMDDKPDKEKVTLLSKAGHTLVFDDAKDDEMAFLKTKGGQKLEFNDKKGDEKLSIVALKDHDLQVDGESSTSVKKAMKIDCKDKISIEAAEEITLKVGGSSITIDKDGITIKTDGKIKFTATKDIKATATGEIKLTATKDIGLTATGNVKIAATMDASVAGLNLKAEGQVGATVKGGATAEISASGVTTVKGSMVMIN